MTPTEAIDALGAQLAAVSNGGSGGHDVTYSASPRGLDVPSVGNYWIPTSAQMTSLVAAFNELVASLAAVPAEVDALGAWFASINNQGTGACALAYSSTTHVLSIAQSATFSPGGQQLTNTAPPGLKQIFNAMISALCGGSGYTGSPFATGGRLMRSGIVIGQSLMCCWNAGSYTIRRPTQLFSINPSTGALGYLTNTPAGTDGSGVSFVAQFGDVLLDNINAANLALCDIAVGGQPFGAFCKGGTYRPRIASAFTYMRALGLEPDFALMGQGQTDASNGITKDAAIEQIMDIVGGFLAQGFKGKFVITKQTVSQNSAQPGSQNIKDAIDAAATHLDCIAVGSDWDAAMNSSHRQSDGTHLNAAGNALASTLCKNDLGPLF